MSPKTTVAVPPPVRARENQWQKPHAARRQRALGALLSLMAPLAGYAQVGDDARPLFADDTPLQLTIEGPFRTLSRNRRDRTELDGIVRYRADDGPVVSLDAQLRTRGNSRLDICTYPPLRLDFRRGQLEGTVFAGQNQLKLVTLCKALAAYRDYLALEYQVYRIFNLLSDTSYRVRWAEVEYIDTDSRRASSDIRPAFLIEEDWEVAERNGMETWRVERLQLRTLEPEPAGLLGLFQFMIGNTDWSPLSGPPGDRCCHNADVLRDGRGQAVLIPYDFDQAGLINTDYAAPAEGLPIRSVRQRLYRGYCRFNNTLDTAVARVNAARDAIETLFMQAAMRGNARQQALRYIEDFYEIINDPEQRLESLDLACRGQTP